MSPVTRGRSLVRRSAELAGGSAIGQVMLIVGTLVGARYFTPSDFGILGVYVTIVVVFGMLSAGRFDAAIPIPRRDGRARDLLETASILVPMVAIASLIFMQTIAHPILSWAGAEALDEIAWMVPAGTATLGFRALFIGWCTRKGFIRTLAVGRALNGTTTGTCFIIGSFTGASLAWLVGAWLAGQAAETIVTAHRVMLDAGRESNTRGYRRRRRALRRYRRFPRILVWSHILEQLGPHLPTTLISGFYGTEIAGVYNIIQRVVARPAAIIGSSVHVMVISEASRRIRSGEDVLPLFNVSIKRLIRVSLVLFLPLAIVGPLVVPGILGPQWARAGLVLLAILPGSAVDFVVVPLVPLLTLAERALTQFGLSVARIAATIVAIAGSSVLGLGSITMLLALSIAIIAIDAASLAACRRAVTTRSVTSE